MRLKSYFAATVEAAVGQAREEMGPEAMIVQSRKAAPEARHLGEYEVVIAELPEEPRPAGLASGEEVGVVAGHAPSELIHREMAELRREIEEMRRAIWRSGWNSGASAAPLSRVAEALAALVEAEVEPELAREVAACVEGRLAGDPLLGRHPGDQVHAGEERLWSALVAEMESRFSVDPTVGRPETEPRVMAVVGPPGCGKTTALVKLAVTHGVAGRRPVQLVSMETYRIAAAEPLRSYAAVLGAGFQALDTTRALAQALEEHRRKGLVLIDTPGYGPADLEIARDLAAFFASRAEIDTHLVLAASTRSADLTHAVERFEMFRPSKLLFTKTDETTTLGPVFSEAVRTGKPVSFLAGGQRIPEDLEAADKRRILDGILRRWAKQFVPAAS
jgi:flagellar biosynthesis protein FlhF